MPFYRRWYWDFKFWRLNRRIRKCKTPQEWAAAVGKTLKV